MIVPALITNSQKELDEMIDKVKSCVERVQLDLMDEKFVPTKSLMFDLKLKPGVGYEAHLMIENSEDWIKKNIKKIDIFLPHFETVKSPNEIIEFVKTNNKKIGFAINPKTPISDIAPYLDLLDMVLIMTVDPGFYGSKFIPGVLPKIRELRTLKPNLDIEVDGSIKPGTIELVKEAGANVFVSGSFILKSDNPGEAIRKLESLTK